MAKFNGMIGFGSAKEVETKPGLYSGAAVDAIEEISYKGDILRVTARMESSNDVNASFEVTNRISIIADPYAYENIFAAKYVVLYGTKWEVKRFKVERPRIILTLGGVYNA